MLHIIGKIFNLRQNYKFYIGVVSIGLAYAILFPIVRDIIAGEKGKVRKFVTHIERAVENEDMFACIGAISDDYRDKFGNDKQTLIYLARETFRYYKNIFVQIDKMDIILSEDKKEAGVRVSGLILGLNNSGNKEIILEKEQGELKIKLIKKENRWQLLEVESFQPLSIMGKGIS